MIPDSNDPRWKRILTEASTPGGLSLATRMLLARLRTRVSQEPSTISGAIGELRDYYAGNRNALGEISTF